MTARRAVFLPLLGAVFGAAGAAIYLGGSRVLPVSVAAFAAVAFWTLVFPVPHENGFGTLWRVAIAVSVLARWQALAHVAAPRILEVCVAAQTVPRAAMVALAWVSRPSGTAGLGFSSTVTTPAALIAIGLGLAAALACGLRAAVVIVAGAYIAIRVTRWYGYWRAGGVNADCLGAAGQILEIYILILFAGSSSL